MSASSAALRCPIVAQAWAVPRGTSPARKCSAARVEWACARSSSPAARSYSCAATSSRAWRSSAIASHFAASETSPRERLRERALLRHACPPGKTRWCRPDLANHGEPGRRGLDAAGDSLRPRGDPLALGRRSDPEHDGPALAHERQAPLGGGRRVCERLRDGDAVRLGRLLLGATPDDVQVRERRRPLLEEQALAPLRLEERHL